MLKATKIYLKVIASSIREYKNYRPLANRGDKKLWEIEIHINQLKYYFRHYHIAYCELRGRTREQIEKPGEFNKPNERFIDEIKKGILDKYEEQKALCASA